MKFWVVSLLSLADAQTCGAPVVETCGTAAVEQCGQPAVEQCGSVQPVVQTYQPPPRVEYQQQPAQTTYQQQPAQTTYQTSYQYVPGVPIAPPPIEPPKQPPMFNLLKKVEYQPFVKIYEHEVPYIHYETVEHQEKCDVTQPELKRFKPEAKNIVRISEEHRTKKALRVVQHFPEPVPVMVPMFLGHIDETSLTAHHRVWYDLPVDVTRIPPQMEIELPGVQKTAGHYEKITRKVTVQPPPVPVTVQPPPVPVTVQPPPVQMVAQVQEQVLQQEQACTDDTNAYSGSTEYYADSTNSGGFVVSLNSNNFYSSISKGSWFVKFFAPWCGHCKRMAPGWESLARDVQVNNWAVTVAEVDCTVNQDVCSRYGATGFPTIKLFTNGVEQGQYSGERTATSYHQWLSTRVSSSSSTSYYSA